MIKKLIILLVIIFNTINLYSRDINWKRLYKFYPKYEKTIDISIEKYELKSIQIDNEIIEFKYVVMAIISWESNWNKDATSINVRKYKDKYYHQYNIGLMQIFEGYYNPVKNINSGCSILRRNLKLYNGNIHKTLSAYNMGIGKVKRHQINKSKYSNKILELAKQTLVGAPALVVSQTLTKP